MDRKTLLRWASIIGCWLVGLVALTFGLVWTRAAITYSYVYGTREIQFIVFMGIVGGMLAAGGLLVAINAIDAAWPRKKTLTSLVALEVE